MKRANNRISPAALFHNLGRNLLHILTWRFGLAFIGAGFLTWVCIATGLDWAIRNAAYNHHWLAYAPLPVVFLGYIVPWLLPLTLYIAGCFRPDTKLRITGLATGQAFLLSELFHLTLKIITGRLIPGVITGVFFEPANHRIEAAKDFSNVFYWFRFDIYNGWPSGHAACAFSAAAVIAVLFRDKILLKAGMFAWAFLMLFSVSMNVHWLSDSIAGALIGYVTGKIIGNNFTQ
ncbi:MAG: phosphatase PAP2 family protein, partial [Treponema sp.]|nr:phosphatase PAP2 family protein [Treponema sp.]